MSFISKKEEDLLSRALAISAFSDDDAMMILRSLLIEKNAEIQRLRTENDFIIKRLEDYEQEANKGAYL